MTQPTRGEAVLNRDGDLDPENAATACEILDWRFWCANGFTCAIVARKGYNNDWTAYISGYDGMASERNAVLFAARYGAKLRGEEGKRVAAALFPGWADSLTWRL